MNPGRVEEAPESGIVEVDWEPVLEKIREHEAHDYVTLSQDWNRFVVGAPKTLKFFLLYDGTGQLLEIRDCGQTMPRNLISYRHTVCSRGKPYRGESHHATHECPFREPHLSTLVPRVRLLVFSNQERGHGQPSARSAA